MTDLLGNLKAPPVGCFEVGRKMREKLYRDYNSYLREIFGCRVQKISIDAGLTCPNRDGTLGLGGCIYCNERGSGTGAAPLAGISRQIGSAKERLVARYGTSKFIAYFQSFSNTYAPLEKLSILYAQALEDPDIVGLSIGTRPDCAPDEVLDHLQELSRTHLTWVEYGLQSANEKTLKFIKRGHGVDAFLDALARTRARKIPVCVHVILGLPGEDTRDMLETAAFLSGIDIQSVKIHLLYVIKGTKLHALYRAGNYRCLTREEYTSAVAEFLTLLPSDIIIQRLTGDPHPEELVAPAWALQKQENINAIRLYMRENNLYQGKNFKSSVPRSS